MIASSTLIQLAAWGSSFLFHSPQRVYTSSTLHHGQPWGIHLTGPAATLYLLCSPPPTPHALHTPPPPALPAAPGSIRLGYGGSGGSRPDRAHTPRGPTAAQGAVRTTQSVFGPFPLLPVLCAPRGDSTLNSGGRVAAPHLQGRMCGDWQRSLGGVPRTTSGPATWAREFYTIRVTNLKVMT